MPIINLIIGYFRAAVEAQQRTWSEIYVFANPGNPLGITAARPIYAPFTGTLLGVAGLDFILSAVESVVTSVIPLSRTKIAYVLDGKSNLMIASSIPNISTSPEGQSNVLECGVPEIEVSRGARRLVMIMNRS